MKYVKKILNPFGHVKYQISEISETWDESIKAFQIKALTEAGYLPCEEVGEVSQHSMFGGDVVKFEEITNENGNIVSFKLKHEFAPRTLKLSQKKLIEHPALKEKIPFLMQIIDQDEILKDWWINNLKYIRGSAVAKKAIEAFGFTETELEAIVVQCIDRSF